MQHAMVTMQHAMVTMHLQGQNAEKILYMSIGTLPCNMQQNAMVCLQIVFQTSNQNGKR